MPTVSPSVSSVNPETPYGGARQAWQGALGRLREHTSAAHFQTYLRDTVGVLYDPGASVLRVQAGNPFHVPWLEGRFSQAVHSAVAEELGAPVRVEFVAGPDRRSPSEVSAGRGQTSAPRERPRPAPAPSQPRLEELLPDTGPSRESRVPKLAAPATARLTGSPLNPRYTFDTFIVGKSNQLAHAASEAVARDPARAYNPLFLYGGVGLGKTHLLHAIGHAVLAHSSDVLYVSSETFTNELIESIRQHRMDDFRAKYRRANLLLVDDIQFIAGKERTEEEFFHTFNAVHESGGQIVLSSDRLPKAMHILEDRLRSRFEWGLIADVQPPDYETRVAILRSKLSGSPGSSVPAEVVDLIAHRVQSNIRELEGSLNRLLAHARHLQQPITLDLAGRVLRDLAQPTGQHVGGAAPHVLLEAISRYFGVALADLKGKARHKEIVVPRQVAMYLLRNDSGLSTPDIGRLLNRDHTTVLHGINIVAGDVARDGPSRASVRGVREVLANGGASRLAGAAA